MKIRNWYHPRVCLPWICTKKILTLVILLVFITVGQYLVLWNRLFSSASTSSWRSLKDADDDETLIYKLQTQHESQRLLEDQVLRMKQEMLQLRTQREELERQIAEVKEETARYQSVARRVEKEAEMEMAGYLQNQLKSAELVRGKKYTSEYDISVYDYFNTSKYIADDPHIIQTMRLKQTEQLQIMIGKGQDYFRDRGYENVYFSDELGGLAKTEPGIGSQFRLNFYGNPRFGTEGCATGQKDKSKNQTLGTNITTCILSVLLFQPYSPLQLVSKTGGESFAEPIHIVVTVSGQFSHLYETLLQTFKEQAVDKNQNAYLTAVYFGQDRLEQARKKTEEFKIKNKVQQVRLISVPDKEFSRSLGIEMAVKFWKDRIGGNVLTFIADVDLAFRSRFLISCRKYAVHNEQVYFPIAFNQFNASLVERRPADYEKLDLEGKTIISSSKYGRWKTESYGAVCVHSDDFLFLDMFNHKRFSTWGREDLYLYRKFAASKLKVIRAPDPDLFHRFHAKNCSSQLPKDIFYNCLGAKAMDYATHTQLGEVIYKTNT